MQILDVASIGMIPFFFIFGILLVGAGIIVGAILIARHIRKKKQSQEEDKSQKKD